MVLSFRNGNKIFSKNEIEPEIIFQSESDDSLMCSLSCFI